MYYNVLSELLSSPLFLYALQKVWSHHLPSREAVGWAAIAAGTDNPSRFCPVTLLCACGGGHSLQLLHVFINPQVDTFAGAVVERTLCVQ